MARFAKDYNIDGWPITDNGTPLDKEEVIAMLNGMAGQIDYLAEEYRKLKNTEPGKYCCCGECD